MALTVEFNKGRALFNNEGNKWGYVKGVAKWAKVLEPGQFGHFSIDLYGDNIEDLVTELEALRDEAYDAVVEGGKKAIKADVYKEDDEGKKFIQFKLPETDYEGAPNKVAIYDVSGKKVDDWDSLIGNGSEVKVKFLAKPYYMGSTKMVGI